MLLVESSFNRTYLELKQGVVNTIKGLSKASIVPIWN